jgi:hypothetical protein
MLHTLGDLAPPQGYETLVFMLFPSQTSSAAVLEMLKRVRCQISSQGDGSSGMKGDAAAAGDGSASWSCILVRTNEAPVCEGLLQQMALGAEWTKTQIRGFTAKGEESYWPWPCNIKSSDKAALTMTVQPAGLWQAQSSW